MSEIEEIGVTLDKISSCSSLKEKQEIIFHYGTHPFLEALKWALDPYKKFGIKNVKIPVSKPYSQSIVTWRILDSWFKQISSGKITGRRLLDAVREMLEVLTAKERIVVTKILQKDLRGGIGTKLVNSMYPGLIPEFGVMLATPLEEKHIKKLQAQKHIYLQPKKNGDRCVIMCYPDGHTVALSRKGHEIHNYKHIEAALAQVTKEVSPFGLVFDGEVISEDFWETRSVKKKAGNNADDAVFYCFDVICLLEWECNDTSSFSTRKITKLTCKKAWLHHNYGCLASVPTMEVDSSSITMIDLNEWRDRLVAAGDEGLIIRLDEPYNFSTRSSLYKHKKMEEGDFIIAEVLPGEEGKKYANTAGSILVELEDGVTCKAGLKMSMSERDEMWKNRRNIVGQIAEIHYQEKTKNKQGKPSLQFPVFIRLREDKS
jgi:hypothetical protein